MTKQVGKTKANQKQHAIERPNDGDVIHVIWSDHRTHSDSGSVFWGTLYMFREKFEDLVRGAVHEAVIYDPDTRIIGSSGELAGTFAGKWKDVEFWNRWDGESPAECMQRTKELKVTWD